MSHRNGRLSNTQNADDPGQTWLVSAWSVYKNHMSSDAFHRHMNFLCKTMTQILLMLWYMKAMIMGRILKLLELHHCLLKVHSQEILLIVWDWEKHQLRCESSVGTHLKTMFANMQRGWGQGVLSRELHTKKVLWGCLKTGPSRWYASLFRRLSSYWYMSEWHKSCTPSLKDRGSTYKMCAVFRPIIEGLIRHWSKIEAVNYYKYVSFLWGEHWVGNKNVLAHPLRASRITGALWKRWHNYLCLWGCGERRQLLE